MKFGINLLTLTRSRFQDRSHLAFRVLLSFAVSLACMGLSTSSKEQAGVVQDFPTLEPGKAVQRELAGGGLHSYRISLSASQYLYVVVDQRGIDVVVRLFSPDGKP